jgi:hypothetical protein
LAINQDGSRAIFTSSRQFADRDRDHSGDCFLTDTDQWTIKLVSVLPPNINCQRPVGEIGLSDDGTRVVFVSRRWIAEVLHGNSLPTLGSTSQVFVHDLAHHNIQEVSIPWQRRFPAEPCRNPCISGDGDWVGFATDSDNMISGDMNQVSDIFVVPVPPVGVN